MNKIPGFVITLVYLFYLYLCAGDIAGDTDPFMIGLDIFCGATCLGGIALFGALTLEGKSSPRAWVSQNLSPAA